MHSDIILKAERMEKAANGLSHDPHHDAAPGLSARNLQPPAALAGSADVGGINVPVTQLRIRVWGDDSVPYIVEGMAGIGEQRSVDQKLTARLGMVNTPQGLGVQSLVGEDAVLGGQSIGPIDRTRISKMCDDPRRDRLSLHPRQVVREWPSLIHGSGWAGGWDRSARLELSESRGGW
jgi:hypothetical protein